MKLLYIHQHFITNEGTGGTRSYDVGRFLVEMGHEVTLICGDYWQSNWEHLPAWKLYEVRNIDGMKVIRLNVRYDNKMGRIGRAWAFFAYAFLSALIGSFQRGVDLVFATSTPLTVSVPARILSFTLRRPYVFEIRDLWPEDLVVAGVMGEGGLQHRIFLWLESLAYGKARRILTVSRGFTRRLIERGLDSARIETVFLGADAALFEGLEPDEQWFKENGLENKVTAVYAGSHSFANGLEQLLDAAELLRDQPNIALVLIGDGMCKEDLQAEASRRNLSNIHFFPPMVKPKLLKVLKGCDLGMIIFRDRGQPWNLTPNKYFDYVFAGLPLVVNYDGTTADMVTQDGTGVATPSGDTEAFAECLRVLAADTDARKVMGRKAAELANREYDRRGIAKQMSDIFETVLSENYSS